MDDGSDVDEGSDVNEEIRLRTTKKRHKFDN